MTASEMGKRGAAARLKRTTKADRSALGRMGQAARMTCPKCGTKRRKIELDDGAVLRVKALSGGEWSYTFSRLAGFMSCACRENLIKVIPARVELLDLIKARGKGGDFSWRNRRWVEIDAAGKTVHRPPLDKIKRGTP